MVTAFSYIWVDKESNYVSELRFEYAHYKSAQIGDKVVINKFVALINNSSFGGDKRLKINAIYIVKICIYSHNLLILRMLQTKKQLWKIYSNIKVLKIYLN